MTAMLERQRQDDDDALERRPGAARTRLPAASAQFCQRVMETIRRRPLSGRRKTWRRLSIFAMPYRALPAAAMLGVLLITMTWFGGFPPTTPREQVNVPPADNSVIVHFRLHDEQARAVHLAGRFSQWEPRYAMRRDGHGNWTVDVPLKPGRYEYMFVIDGQKWVADPSVHCIEDDGFGGRNSVIIVTAGDKKGGAHVENS